MTPQELTTALSRRGIQLWVEGERLCFRAPGGALSPELRQALQAQKAGVIDHLKGEETAAEAKLPAVRPAPEERHRPFPLTEIQQAYWVGRSHMFELGNVSAHIYQEFDLRALDPSRFERAWQRLIDRHEMLRTVMLPSGEQEILATVVPYEIPRVDLRDLPPEDAADRLEAVREELSHHGPDTDRWPLFDLRFYRLDEQRWRLAISVSLLVCDALSFRNLLAELMRLYEEPKAVLPALELSFRDYVLAAAEREHSEGFQRALEDWRRRLPQLPSPPELPLARRPSQVEQPRFQRRRSSLDAGRWNRLKARARDLGVTPTVVVATAYAEVLSHWSKSPHFLLNLLFFNRLPLHPQVSQVVGNFSSTLLLEVDFRQARSFGERARALQEQLWSHLELQVSGIRVLREHHRQAAGATPMTVPVVLASTLDLGPRGAVPTTEESLRGEIVFGCLQTPQVWLDHQISEDRDGVLWFNWDAVEELFPAGLVQEMFDAHRGLLERLADADATWEVPIGARTPTEHLAERAAVNNTRQPLSPDLLHSGFLRQAARRGTQTAVVGRRRLSYRELDLRSLELARQLLARGARRGELIPVVMDKGWEQVVATLAILRAGAAYLPIDSALPEQRWHALVSEVDARLAVTQPWLEDRLAWPQDLARLVVDEGEVPEDGPPLPALPTGPSDLAYVIYTSGSTGRPKGVVIDHRGAVNTLHDIERRFDVGSSDRVLALSSLSFDLSVFDLFGVLAAGGTVVFPDAAAQQDPAHWTELVVREGVTVWNSVPVLLQLWVDSLPEGSPVPQGLRLALLSGDWIPIGLPDAFRRHFPSARVISLGGATEASIWSIFFPIDRVADEWSSIPYGRPLANQSFQVLDGQLAPRPRWVPGELYIGGVGLARGYWRAPEKTNGSFFHHPETGERLYRTGDWGRYLLGGDIEFLGREDAQVKVRGYRIELGEIEATLERCPGVQAAAVAALGEAKADKRLVGYAVAAPGEELTVEAVREFLGRTLPPYMVPTTFVWLDALPLSANGKVDRRALPAPGEVSDDASREAAVPPRNAAEQGVARIWCELLELEAVGVHDNFFELGGHSVLAVRLMNRLREHFLQDLPLSALLEAPTVAELTALLYRPPSHRQTSLVAIQPRGEQTPFFCVHPVGGNILCYAELARCLGPDQPFFGLQGPDFERLSSDFRLEEMAELYAEEVRRQQPEGRYFLGGWSLGGTVAFEIARRLRAEGRDVALVAMIDPPVAKRQPAPELGATDLLLWFARDLATLAGGALELDRAKLEALDEEARSTFVLHRAQEAEILPQDLEADSFHRLVAAFQANSRALDRYVPEPGDGPLWIVRARDEATPEGFDETLGWSRLANAVHLEWVPGSHYDVVRPPQVERVARKLLAALAQSRCNEERR